MILQVVFMEAQTLYLHGNFFVFRMFTAPSYVNLILSCACLSNVEQYTHCYYKMPILALEDRRAVRLREIRMVGPVGEIKNRNINNFVS